MPGSSVNYRQRFVLYKLNRSGQWVEVAGGPYYRDVAAERAAEAAMRIDPRGVFCIDREEKQLVNTRRPGTNDPSVLVEQWTNAGTIWTNAQQGMGTDAAVSQ